jgi:hypothetical protein
VQPARKADNLAVIYEPMSRRCGSLDFSYPYGPSRPVTGIALLYFTWGETGAYGSVVDWGTMPQAEG